MSQPPIDPRYYQAGNAGFYPNGVPADLRTNNGVPASYHPPPAQQYQPPQPIGRYAFPAHPPVPAQGYGAGRPAAAPPHPVPTQQQLQQQWAAQAHPTQQLQQQWALQSQPTQFQLQQPPPPKPLAKCRFRASGCKWEGTEEDLRKYHNNRGSSSYCKYAAVAAGTASAASVQGGGAKFFIPEDNDSGSSSEGTVVPKRY